MGAPSPLRSDHVLVDSASKASGPDSYLRDFLSFIDARQT